MIKSLLLSLALTLAIETLVAAILGVRKKKDFLLIALVNIVTNPLLAQTLNILNLAHNRRPAWYFVFLLEAAAVIAEGLLYRNRLHFKKIDPFLFSLILNIVSYFGGSVFNEVF